MWRPVWRGAVGRGETQYGPGGVAIKVDTPPSALASSLPLLVEETGSTKGLTNNKAGCLGAHTPLRLESGMQRTRAATGQRRKKGCSGEARCSSSVWLFSREGRPP